ncbi:MAG: alpha/beta fold hydrolase [Pseudomonadota bacterium]
MSAQTFVLVHGTWHGGWIWRDVRAMLSAAGHRVFTPTCTGCGEREHLSAPDVGLETHISDIMGVIEAEELEDVILVGHSFSGVTITGVADRMRSRIKRIVFFDAIVPREGRMSGVEYDLETGELPDSWLRRREKFIDGYKMEFWAEYPIKMLVPESETDVIARLKRLITTHPAKQWEDVLTVNNGGWEGLAPAFIHCVGQDFAMTSERMVGPARGPGWTFIPADIPRNGMMTHPKLVSDLLISLS